MLLKHTSETNEEIKNEVGQKVAFIFRLLGNVEWKAYEQGSTLHYLVRMNYIISLEDKGAF